MNMKYQPLSRRRFLQGVGVAMSLPLLDVMQPSLARAASDSFSSAAIASPSIISTRIFSSIASFSPLAISISCSSALYS